VSAVSYYFSFAVPFLWCAVALFGAWIYWRSRTIEALLIVLGCAILGANGVLSVFFGYRALLDENGEVQAETPGLMSPNTQILLSELGAILLMAGIVLLLVRLNQAKRDA
jgi:hypothetical protein